MCQSTGKSVTFYGPTAHFTITTKTSHSSCRRDGIETNKGAGQLGAVPWLPRKGSEQVCVKYRSIITSQGHSPRTPLSESPIQDNLNLYQQENPSTEQRDRLRGHEVDTPRGAFNKEDDTAGRTAGGSWAACSPQTLK